MEQSLTGTMILEPGTTTEASPGRTKHVPGEPGAWIFILGDMCVFAVFFSVYLVRRGHDPVLFAHAQGELNRNLGALNTIFLLVSSLLVVVAVRAVREEAFRPHPPRLFLGAMACGGCFIVVKAFEYHEKLAAGITPATNDFFMYYFVLTGLHLFHLLIGMGVLTVLWRFSRHEAPLSPHKLAFVEGAACFWHMVDLLWIVLFPLLFLVR
jgi:nitric oxide reductase NorE protein